MTDTATDVFVPQLGERVEVRDNSYDAEWREAIVYGLHNSRGGSPDSPTHAWVTVSNPSVYGYPAQRMIEQYSGAPATRIAADIPADTRGRWFTLVGGDVRRLENPDATPEAAPDVATLQATVASLQNDVERLNQQVANQAQLLDTARTVIERIGQGMAARADNVSWRSTSAWCGDYEASVEAVYEELPSHGGFDQLFREAASREREYTVEFRGSITVTASSSAAARDAAWDHDYAPDSDFFEIYNVTEA